MSLCFRRKSSRLNVVPLRRPRTTPRDRASANPDLMRSRSVSDSLRAISASSASIIPAAGLRLPFGRSVSIDCACQYRDSAFFQPLNKPVRDTILASYTRDFMDQALLDFALAGELLRSAQSVALVIFRAA